MRFITSSDAIIPENIKKTEIINLIERAFKSVILGDGVGIYEAEAIDDYASKKEIQEAKTKDRDSWERWHEIPTEVMETYYSILCFVDVQGMRFLLLAYIKYAIENYDKSSSASIDAAIYALSNNPVFVQSDIDDYFTKVQYSVLARFLRYMVLDVEEGFVDSFCASLAYEKLWVKYDEIFA